MTLGSHERRRIIEALRTGVPTHAAVEALGSGQPELEERFSTLKSDVRAGRLQAAGGFIFNGSFGSGKSHLLEAFATSAISDGFVVSHAVVSKNLPLHGTLPILYELMMNTETRVHHENTLSNLIADAIFDSGNDLASLRAWVRQQIEAETLAPLFNASLSALRNLQYGAEDVNTIVDYWSGATVPVAALNAAIRRAAPFLGKQKAPVAAQRPWQTIRFLARLFLELGHPGWIVLFDEVELIRLQGPVSRGKAYAELTRWFGLDAANRIPGLGSVASITPDFVRTYVDSHERFGERDAAIVPTKLSLTVNNAPLAPLAVAGMDFLVSQETNKCHVHDRTRLRSIQAVIRGIYDDAFSCTAPQLPVTTSGPDELRSVRTHIRRWITLWDLHRQGRLSTLQESTVEPQLDEASDDDE